MKTSIYKYKTLFLFLFSLFTFCQFLGYAQQIANRSGFFQEVKFDSNQECCEAFVTPASDQSNLPAHNLNTKTDTPQYFIVYDLSNYIKSDRDLTGIDFSKAELNSYQNEFYTNTESISQKLPFEKALSSDILLI